MLGLRWRATHFPPSPTTPFPVPNKPSHFCGCKATYLLTYYARLQSPLDTDVGEASALRAVEISEQLTQGGAALQSQPESCLADDAASTRWWADLPDSTPGSFFLWVSSSFLFLHFDTGFGLGYKKTTKEDMHRCINWLPVFRRIQELCESQGGCPGLRSLISLRFLWT